MSATSLVLEDVVVRRLRVHDRVTIRKIAYCRPEPCPGGYRLVREDDPDHQELFTHEQLEDLHRRDQLDVDPEHYKFPFRGDRRYVDVTSVDILNRNKRAQVLRKLEIVREIDQRVTDGARILSDAKLNRLLNDLFAPGSPFWLKINQLSSLRGKSTKPIQASGSVADISRQPAYETDPFFKPPSSRSARVWYRNYIDCGRNPLILAGNYHNVGAKKIAVHPDVQAHMNAALGICEFDKTIAKRYADMVASIGLQNEGIRQKQELVGQEADERCELLPVPSFYLFRQEIKKQGAFKATVRSKGMVAALRRFTPLASGLDVRAIGERVEMDGWECNLKVIFTEVGIMDLVPKAQRDRLERRKACFVTALECASRVVVGLAVSQSSNSDAVLNARAQVGIDKSHFARSANCRASWHHRTGAQTVVSDNGKEFTSGTFVAAEHALGESGKVAAPAARPDMKGMTESLFKRFSKHFQGSAGWTELRHRLNDKFDSDQHAQLVLDELVKLFIRYVVDNYNQSPHRGLGGAVPAAMWDQLMDKRGAHPLASASKRRIAFGTELHRVIGKHGVTFLGIDYQSHELQEHFRSRGNVRVAIHVDRWDLRAVSIKINGKFLVAKPRRALDLANVGIEAWLEARRLIRVRNKAQAQMREEFVNAAIADANALFAQTAYRAVVPLQPWTVAELDLKEKALGAPLAIEGDEVADPGANDFTFGVPAESFPVSEATTNNADAINEPRPPNKSSRFVKKDGK